MANEEEPQRRARRPRGIDKKGVNPLTGEDEVLTDREKTMLVLDEEALRREFTVRKGERDVMMLLSSTWETDHSLGSMKKAFTTVSDAAASKSSQLDGLAARIERMQSELRNAPGGSGLSSTHKVRTGGGAKGGAPGGASGGTSPQKGGRRSGASSAAAAGAAAAAADAQTDAQQSAQASSIKEGGAGAGAAPVTSSSSSSPSKGGKNQSSSRPSSREKAPVGSQMTAAERIAAELSREEGIILVTCSACRMQLPAERYEEHRTSCLAAARRRRKVTEEMGLLESPAQISPCAICGFFFENREMDRHYRQCLRSKVPDKKLVDEMLPSEAPILPRPPTHLSVVERTHNSITLAWREPLFRGFLAITDHIVQVTHMGGVAMTEDVNLAKARRDAAEKAKQAKVRQEAEEAAKKQASLAANEKLKAVTEAPKQEDPASGKKTSSSNKNNGPLSPVGEHDEEKNGQNNNTNANSATATGGDAKGEGSGGASIASAKTEQSKASFAGVLASAAAPLPPKRRPGERWLVPTTTWILKDPLAAHGYTIRGLSAETKYRFQVKCSSVAGGSAFNSTPVDVSTRVAVAPGPCLYFAHDTDVELKDPTTSLALRWSAPTDNGGVDVADYEISYYLSVVRAKVSDVAHGMYELKKLRVRTGYFVPAPVSMDQSDRVTRFGDKYRGMTWRGEVRYILRGLEGGCAYRNLEVRAINSSGYISLTSLTTIDTIALAVPPREETLLKEYRRALLEEKEAIALGLVPTTKKKRISEAFGGNFFDSSFYFMGSFQRFPRQYAVEKLMEKCQEFGVADRAKKVYAEVKDKDINLAWMMPSDEKRGIVGGVSGVLSEQYHGSADDQVMAHAHNNEGDGEVPMTAEEIKAEEDFVIRSEQYRLKMRHLRRLAEFLQESVKRNRDSSLSIVPQIRRWEAKARKMEVELGRVNTFRGVALDSDSLTGGRMQRFRKADLAALLNDKIEELMDQVQTGKRDLILLNQESSQRIKAAVKAWRKYEERTAAYFRFRSERAAKLKAWPSDFTMKQNMFQHWLWITATKTLHMRALRVIFARLWFPMMIAGWRKFYDQCFRAKASKFRSNKGSSSSSVGTRSEEDSSKNTGESGSRGGGGNGDSDDSDDDEGSRAAKKEAREAEKRRVISSIGDLGLEEVLGGRERLLDELRHQVARTAHFNGVQKVVFANGPSAANFFLAEKHRHMPSAGRAQDSGSTGMVTGKQKGGQGGGKDEHGSSGPQKKAVGMGEDDNPKGELVDELRKIGVHDPPEVAALLFHGSQSGWSDVAWSFHSGGVRGLKETLLHAGVDTNTIGKLVGSFVKQRFELAKEGSNQRKSKGKGKTRDGEGGMGADSDSDDDDEAKDGGGLASGLENTSHYTMDDEEVSELPDGTRAVAVRWMDEDQEMGTFDLCMQRILAMLNIEDYEGANALCKKLHSRCPPNKGLDATGGIVAIEEPGPAPIPCSAAEASETLYLSLSQQSMLWLQQGKAQLGLFKSGYSDRARNSGKIGAQLEFAVYCMDEAIDRARGWAVIDMREKLEEQKAEEEGADEVEDPAKEAEQKRIEDEEEAAALAVGDTSYKRKPTKLSKKRQRREEQKKRALTGEEWSADALLCWSYEAKGDMLSTLEEHFAATEQYKLSLRHLIYLRKQRAVEDTLHHETAKGLEQGLTAERAAERAQLAVNALLAKFDEDEGEARAGAYQLDPPGHKRSIGGRLEEATLCEKIAREYARNEDEGKAKRWRGRAKHIGEADRSRRAVGKARLDNLYEKMLDDAKAELAEDVILERCSDTVPSLRLQRLATLEEIEDTYELLADARDEAGSRAAKLSEAQADLEHALKSESETVESGAFGARATYPVAEFRALVERQVKALGSKQVEALKRVRHVEITLANLQDTLQELEESLRVETGALMQRAVKRARLIRCLVPNLSNALANDVTGAASGGVKLFAAAMGTHANVYDIETGCLMQVLLGQPEDQRKGQRPTGHTAKITVVFFLQYRLYTGDHDGLIFVWNVSDGRGGLSGKKKKKTKKELAAIARANGESEVVEDTIYTPPAGAVPSAQCVVDVLDDHDGAVTAIAGDEEKLVSGSSDLSVKVWDNEVGPNGEEPTFALLFSLRGHTKSITALQIGYFTFASGDASGQVRVWELIQPASAGGPSEASASAAGGFAGQATVWIGPDGQDPKWARCRCVLRVKHQRSEDAPDYAKGPISEDEALAARLAKLHRFEGEDVETAQHEAERLDGHILAREGAAELNVRQFMKRDPGPEGRIRVHGITALQYYGSELTCGDAHGKVFIWNIAEKKCMWDLQAHTGRVWSLQCDAIRVVTGGADGFVRILDVMTGRPVQSFQAHAPNTPVLLMQFDAVQLLTGGADGHIKRWLWSAAVSPGDNASEGSVRETKHFVAPGDSLRSIATKYGSSVPNIMKWNKLTSGQDMYLGMSIVVDRQSKAIENHEHNTRSFMAEDELPRESELMHPSYGLKAMEAQVYKGRQPHPT